MKLQTREDDNMDGLTCLGCNAYYDDYSQLKHYDEYTGGFCRECGYEHFVYDSEREDEDE